MLPFLANNEEMVLMRHIHLQCDSVPLHSSEQHIGNHSNLGIKQIDYVCLGSEKSLLLKAMVKPHLPTSAAATPALRCP